MDIINVSVATPLISFGATGDGLYQRAMDGNIDETYVVDFGLVLSGSNDVSIRPNGVTANQEGRRYTGGSSLRR
jgi:inner membrane protein involved in colicin E2 resistance